MEVVQISIWALISDSQEVISWNAGNWVWMQSWVEHPACTLGSFGSSRALGLWRGEQLQRSPKCLLHDSGCVWWPCLASFYAYQALYQMLTWLHPQYLLGFFLHGNASGFPNVCVLLTKAVGFIFKSLPLHFLHVLFCWTLMTEGHMILLLPFYKLRLSFILSFYYLQFKENVQHPGCLVAG